MKKLIYVIPILFFGLSACGGGGGGGEPPPGGGPEAPNFDDGINTLIIDQGVFDNLSQLLQQQTIELEAEMDESNLTLKTSDVVKSAGGVIAILNSRPSGNINGEICTYRIESVINITGSGEFDVELSGKLTGKYTIRECNVQIDINTSNTQWAAIRTQNFGPQDAAVVFLEGIEMSKHVDEDTTLLYIGSFAETVVNQFDMFWPWPVLANEARGIVCMNANIAVPGYVSYFTPKVVHDPNPPVGYTTADLPSVNKPVAFISNCVFEYDLWFGIWNNT